MECENGTQVTVAKGLRTTKGDAMLPNDPNMLLSVLNLKLRDYYPDLDALCDDLDVDREDLLKKMDDAGYHYDPEGNCFR